LTTTIVPTHDAHGSALVGVDELAVRLGKTRRGVYGLVEGHALPAVKLGRSLMFDLGAVARWLEDRRVGDWVDDEAA
jgi:excisionase family DNA binding protein